MTDSDWNKPGPGRKWPRCAGIAALGLLVLIAAIHRPIFFRATRYFIIRAARQQKLELAYQMSGTIFTTLRVENLHMTPIQPGPIDRIDINRIAMRYSLLGFLRHGLPGLLEELDLIDTHIELSRSGEKRPEPKARKKQELKFPALIPKRLNIENLNLIVHQEDKGDIILSSLNLTLNPDSPGALHIERLSIPGVHDWSGVSAQATYEQRNFVLNNLRLGPELAVRRLNLDASKLAEHRLSFAFSGTAFDGTLDAALAITDLNRSNQLSLRAAVDGVSFDQASAYFHLRSPIGGTLDRARLNFEGKPEEPKSWTVTASLAANRFTAGGFAIDLIEAGANITNGAGSVRVGKITIGANTASVNANVKLPGDLSDMATLEAAGQITVDAPQLGDASVPGLQRMTGSIAALGPFTISGGVLSANLDISAQHVESELLGVKNGRLDLKLTKRLGDVAKKRLPEKPFFEGLEVKMSSEAEGLRFRDYQADSIKLDLNGKDGRLSIEKAEIKKGGNAISAGGTYLVPAEPGKARMGGGDLRVNISAPALKQFVLEATGARLDGALTIDGSIRQNAGGAMNGVIAMNGSNLAFEGFRARKMNASIKIINGVAHIDSFRIEIDDDNDVIVSGETTVKPPVRYDGSIEARLGKLSAFQALIKAPEGEKPSLIAGTAALKWSGKGDVARSQHAGEISFSAEAVKFGRVDIKNAKLAGMYSPEVSQFSEFKIVSGETSLDGLIEVFEGKLKLHDIHLQQKKQMVLTGYIIIPFDVTRLNEPKSIISPDKRIAANVNASDLDIAKLMASFGKESPATGSVSAALLASGTLREPSANLKVSGRNLKPTAKGLNELKAADFDLQAHYIEKKLTLDATINQGDIQPVTLKGESPVDVRAVVEKRAIDPATPVALTLTLPKSSLNFLSRVVPYARYVDGAASADVRIGGTVGRPVMQGGVNLDLTALRFKNPNMPAINEFKAGLNFTENRITIERFGGDVGGGPFRLTGRIDFPKLTQPALDLVLKSDNTLLVRNESITLRADSDIKIKGPFNAAAVSGSAAITHSRFFREVDLLPIELPGRPAPKPPDTGAPGVSFPKPPLRDWTFDVAIKTKDPFLIRGNLNNGSALVDLKFVGTGLNPALDGSVRIEDFTASLPFSKLEVTRGYVHFTRDKPFEPELDIQGSSQMRDYNIGVSIYGDAFNPQTIFSSDPPLPPEDIISLLATGTTTSELTGNADVLAGRASVLLFQKLYRTVFKKKAPSEKETFLDRFDVEIGGVDPRTGHQEVGARFKVSPRVYIIGDLDVQGDIRGQVKYLLRFR